MRSAAPCQGTPNAALWFLLSGPPNPCPATGPCTLWPPPPTCHRPNWGDFSSSQPRGPHHGWLLSHFIGATFSLKNLTLASGCYWSTIHHDGALENVNDRICSDCCVGSGSGLFGSSINSQSYPSSCQMSFYHLRLFGKNRSLSNRKNVTYPSRIPHSICLL